MIDEVVIDKVKEVVLHSFIGQFVKLKKNGTSWIGSCPFHAEKTPSFSVNSKKGYKCFGCGTGGSNAIDFIMVYEKLSFADAVIRAATLSNIYISDNYAGINTAPVQFKQKADVVQREITFIPAPSVKRFLDAFSRNFLYCFFVSRYETKKTDEVFKLYNVGSCSLYKELGNNTTTLFLQKDINGRIRQLGAIPYNPTTGKRRKEKELIPKRIGLPHLKFMGMKEADIYLVQCFFGEHLLNGNTKPVALVESEKTAMIASLHYPQFVWLATGGSFGVGKPKTETWGLLKGREVHMYPDADKLYDWIELAAEYEDLFGEEIQVHDILGSGEIPEGVEKWDIADILLTADVPLPQDEISINQDNIEYYPRVWNSCAMRTGYCILTFQTKDGYLIDVLFDEPENGDPLTEIPAGEEQQFIPGVFYGAPCMLRVLAQIDFNSLF